MLTRPDDDWRNMEEMFWETSTADLRLVEDEVHVWRASLRVAPPELAAYRELLAPEEAERADRFRFPQHRDRFVVAHATLRLILARYTRLGPTNLRFEYGPHGKPSLRPAVAAGARFNLSHSGDLALYAVTCGREVGVDLERHRPDVECDKIADRFFSPAEVAALLALPPAEQRPAFFRCWSRKEAYIKALGMGLALPLDQFDVSLHPEEPARLLQTRHAPEERDRWSMWALEPGPGYAGALVVEGQGLGLRCRQFGPE